MMLAVQNRPIRPLVHHVQFRHLRQRVGLRLGNGQLLPFPDGSSVGLALLNETGFVLLLILLPLFVVGEVVPVGFFLLWRT